MDLQNLAYALTQVAHNFGAVAVVAVPLYALCSMHPAGSRGLLTGACLLRLYMQLQRIPFANPVGQLVFALTDWLVMPLRRVIPPAGRWDLSSLVAALLLQAAQYLLLWLFFGGVVPVAALVLSGLTGLLIVYALLSWVQTRSPIAGVIERLSEPLLRPLRRVVPLVGGLDLAPLVALVLLQVAMIVLGHLQAGALVGLSGLG